LHSIRVIDAVLEQAHAEVHLAVAEGHQDEEHIVLVDVPVAFQYNAECRIHEEPQEQGEEDRIGGIGKKLGHHHSGDYDLHGIDHDEADKAYHSLARELAVSPTKRPEELNISI